MNAFEGTRFSQIKGVPAQNPLLRKESGADALKHCESIGKMDAVAEDDSPLRGLRHVRQHLAHCVNGESQKTIPR